jgi:hypothetical protein
MSTAGGSVVVTQAPGHTIRGRGTLAAGTYVNHGRMEGLSGTELLVIQATLLGDGMLKDVQIGGLFTQVPHVLGNVGGTAVVPVQGLYQFARNSSLVVDLGGTTPGSGYDQLQSTGPMTLSSTATRLEVSILSSFVPSPGDTFTVMTTTSQQFQTPYQKNKKNQTPYWFGETDFTSPTQIPDASRICENQVIWALRSTVPILTVPGNHLLFALVCGNSNRGRTRPRQFNDLYSLAFPNS